jgi:hypothetical protein
LRIYIPDLVQIVRPYLNHHPPLIKMLVSVVRYSEPIRHTVTELSLDSVRREVQGLMQHDPYCRTEAMASHRIKI